MEDHHNVADLFHQVRTHGKWGCGNMVQLCANEFCLWYQKVPMSSARFEFCTVLVSAIFTYYGVHGEKLQMFCL